VLGLLLKHAGQPSPIFQVQIRHLRASDEVGHAGVAAADPAAQYCALVWAPVPLPEYEGPAREALAALKDAISEPDLARLREIKQKVDPLGVLLGNYPLS
jgi:hypothetical protein